MLADIDERVTSGIVGQSNSHRVGLGAQYRVPERRALRGGEGGGALGARAQRDLPEWLARRGMATHLLNEAHALAYAGFYRDAPRIDRGCPRIRPAT